MSEPSVCFGCEWVRNTALERKWSPPISFGLSAAASGCLTSVVLVVVRYSRYASSDLSAVGPRSKSRPVAAGAHMLSFAPNSFEPAAPCTISMATNRVGAAPVFRPPRMPTGTIASRYGSANVAPRPRTKVRRGSGLPVRKCMFGGSWSLTVGAADHRDFFHPEGVTQHDAGDEILHAEAILLRIVRDLSDRRHVVPLDAASDGVRHQVLREGAD